MKPFTKEVIAAARKLQTRTDVLRGKRVKLDMRYNFNKEIKAYMNWNPLGIAEQQKILEKRKIRWQNKQVEYKNVLSNPIVVDYRKNGKYCMVYCNHLRFADGRNHWAKTSIDYKVLAVLEKYNRKIKIY
jgi:hypothetical protein